MTAIKQQRHPLFVFWGFFTDQPVSLCAYTNLGNLLLSNNVLSPRSPPGCFLNLSFSLLHFFLQGDKGSPGERVSHTITNLSFHCEGPHEQNDFSPFISFCWQGPPGVGSGVAVKGEKGSPVRAVNRRRCADTLFWRHIHLLIAFCIIRVFQDFRDLGVLQDLQDLRAEKGRR